jgi:hypothetical protein
MVAMGRHRAESALSGKGEGRRREMMTRTEGGMSGGEATGVGEEDDVEGSEIDGGGVKGSANGGEGDARNGDMSHPSRDLEETDATCVVIATESEIRARESDDGGKVSGTVHRLSSFRG